MERDRERMLQAEVVDAFKPSATTLGRLRNTVLARLLLVAMVPLVILSLYFRQSFLETLRERSRLQLETIAVSHRNYLDRFMQNKVDALRGAVRSGLVNLPPGKEEIERLYTTLQTLDDTILDVGVFDEKGTHLRYAGPFIYLEGKNYSDEPWFAGLIDETEHKVFVSDVFLGKRKEPHFIIAVRKERDGKVWVVRMTINPTTFARLVDDVRQAVGAQGFIVNENGLYQSVPEEIGKPLEKTEEWKCPDEKDLACEMGDYLISPVKLTSVPWTLVVRQPLDIAYAPAKSLRAVIFALLGFGAIFIIAASIYATETLIRKYARSERNRSELIEQLVQTGKMSTMGEMAAGIAHEINNPLAIIQSEIGLMQDYLDPQLNRDFDRPTFVAMLQSIKEETNRAKDIIHKLLGFARRTKPTIAPCSLNELVSQSVELIDKELALENIEIVQSLDDSIFEINTDAAKIKQVLLNLIKNAADAIGKDGRIEVTTERAGDKVRCSVSDTGKGIPEEDLQQIFLPFFTTKEVGKGTGLGLSISHGIVTSLGGEIHVASRLGHGTRFTIVLPLQ